MKTIYQGPFAYETIAGFPLSRCVLCILQPREDHPQRIVFVIDSNDHQGKTLANAVEYLATFLVQEFSLDHTDLLFLTHAPSEGYSAVSFTWGTDPEGQTIASNPQWIHLSPAINEFTSTSP